MISNPKYGWCDFELGNWFSGRASYLTDVPMDLLDAFIDYHENGHGVVVFDSEGAGSFTLVMTAYNRSIYIIEERKERTIHFLDDFRFEDLERDLILDIERNLNGWVQFMADEDPEENTQRRNELRQRVAKLKKYRDWEKTESQLKRV